MSQQLVFTTHHRTVKHEKSLYLENIFLKWKCLSSLAVHHKCGSDSHQQHVHLISLEIVESCPWICSKH